MVGFQACHARKMVNVNQEYVAPYLKDKARLATLSVSSVQTNFAPNQTQHHFMSIHASTRLLRISKELLTAPKPSIFSLDT
mmetsp:Transcript_10903/g.30605  ORF Transcript_10903/g.30605 Transcript_10903/m.30605 type:complete len:81 (-) Transcript_10903:715-957(-)